MARRNQLAKGAPQNSTRTVRKPPPGRPFQKGKSGNPGGRPKSLRAEVLAKYPAASLKAVEALLLIATGTDRQIKKKFGAKYGPKFTDRVAAAEKVLDRLEGRPVQEVKHDGNVSVNVEGARARIATRLARLVTVQTASVIEESDRP